jgi:DNA replication protein DnaC
MEVVYTETNAVCQDCGTEFTAKVYNVLGHQFPQRYCRECSAKLIEQERLAGEATRQAEIATIRRKWRENCGIGLRYMSSDFSTFKTDRPGNIAEIYRMCLEYADQFPIDYDVYRKRTGNAYGSLLLSSVGVWGNGKTHLVSAITHRIIDRWNGENIACPVRFISEPDIYDRIQQTYSYSYEEREKKLSEQEIIHQLCRVRLLIIDDLGKVPRRDMDFVRRTMFNVINRRYDALLPVVITTNKNAEGLRDYLGNSADQATLDRLFEMTEGMRLQVKGTSYRRERK